jgi:plasmid stabilization system protein ParE
MSYRVRYAPRSQRDLEKIHAWIATDSNSSAVATRFLGELFEACNSLATLPERFAPYPYAKRWRMMPFGNYLVFFQVHEGEVRIGHIRHAARRSFGG